MKIFDKYQVIKNVFIFVYIIDNIKYIIIFVNI